MNVCIYFEPIVLLKITLLLVLVYKPSGKEVHPTLWVPGTIISTTTNFLLFCIYSHFQSSVLSQSSDSRVSEVITVNYKTTEAANGLRVQFQDSKMVDETFSNYRICKEQKAVIGFSCVLNSSKRPCTAGWLNFRLIT